MQGFIFVRRAEKFFATALGPGDSDVTRVSFGYTLFLLVLSTVPTLAMADTTITPITQWYYTWQETTPAAENIRLWLRQQTDRHWQETSHPQKLPDSRNKKQVWLRTTLPALDSREPALFIPPVYLLLTVYVDGQEIYRFDDPDQARGLPWHLIDLPEDYAGKNLALRIRSDYTQIGVSDDILLGSHSQLLESMIRRDVDRVVIGLLLGVFGLLALSFSPRRQETVAYIAFGAYTLCLAAWIISHSYVKQLVLPYPSVWFYVWLAGLLGMFPSFMLYVEKVFGLGLWQALRRLRQFYLVFVPVLLLAYWMLGSVPLVQAGLNLVRVLFVAGIVLTVFQAGRLALRGRRDALVFLLGFCILTLFTIHDVSLALGLITDGRTLSHWGGLVLALIMAAILGGRFNNMYHRLADYSKQLESTARERELMVQDLHDGLGGMATNISLLADVARRQCGEPAVRKTLETISGLSRESVSEIRGFMKSLDHSGADWPSFVADLRQYGTATLEPHGIDFTLTDSIETDMEAPNSLLRLNVLRIYKEAVTNIVKHADAKNVAVDLKVSPHRFRLSIRDDGVGLKENRGERNKITDSGRGLGNIEARTTSMGGEVRLRSDNGTHVEATIPLPLKSPVVGIEDEAKG